MKFYGTKKDGKLVMPPAIAEEKRKFWDRIPDGAEIESAIVVKRRDKSQAQLGAIWGLMLAQAVNELHDRGYDTSFIYNLDKPTGIPIDTDDLCQFFYQACPIRDTEGNVITLRRADTEQANKFFEDVRNWLASQWSISIPDPDPNWRNKK
jgi:hypothetical protein